MKKKIFVSIIGVVVIFILLVMPREINVSKVVDLTQSNCKSITVNNKNVEAGTSKQYLIDDFIPKLSRYTIKTYDGELPQNYSYKVDIKNKDNSEIILFDNNYLVINNIKYIIVKGRIDLDKFYNIFM